MVPAVVLLPKIEKVNKLPKTKVRGEDGFGSTDIKIKEKKPKPFNQVQ